MVGRNNEFMEAYKHLDKICREMFNSEKGVTTYIDEMEAIKGGAFSIKSWNSTLRKLKEYRHIRNTYVHEVGTSSLEICTIDDINWLNTFYDDIMQSRDPLAQYRILSEQRGSKSFSKSKKIRITVAKKPIYSTGNEDLNISLCRILCALIAIDGILLFIILLIIINS